MIKNAVHAANSKHTTRRLAVGYVRVSTIGQGNSGISLAAQRLGIEAFAEAMKYEVIEIFEDIASGVGENSFFYRKNLRHALEMVVREDAVLIVWDWDRLSRYAGFEEQVQKVISERNRIICAKEGNTMLEASRAATLANKEKFAKEISRTTKEGIARRTAEGVIFGNPEISTTVQPMGVVAYSNAADDLVRRIADVLRCLEDPFGITYARIAEILNEKAIRTLHGKEWTVSRARGPVTKARDILRSEDEVQRNPIFGLF